MRIGVSAFAWTATFDESHLEIIPQIASMGLSGVEIPMFDPSALPAKGIRAACETYRLDCTVCAILPQAANPISPDPVSRQKAVEHLRRCIETSAAMGARLIGGPLFAPIGYLPEHRPTEDEWRWAVEIFQSIAHVLEEYDMTLSLEPVNRSESFFLRTAAEAMRLCRLIGSPRIGVTIDTFHANIEEQSIARAISSLAHYLKHIHASENDRGLLGRGHVPFRQIVSTLQSMGYEGYLMIEGFGYDPSERNGPGWLWASTDVSPVTIASEGAEFLRGLLAMTPG